jgi:hypothetical protein
MTFSLIQESALYKEETTYTDSYILRGVHYDGTETTTYPVITGTHEPQDDGEESLPLPSGVASSDARMLYTDEQLLTHSDTGDLSLADRIFFKDPEAGRVMPQRYVVMAKEDWGDDANGFTLIGIGEANSYLLVKEEKVVA